ncbi:BZ3500_MvSof-1268-A1-R1_Chr7-1g09313 [Microbotryum saponariae]|uniref:BZ3500_MvSof-1268-A1-R1_Chr7-1g09313 protein n=1 Tax=Microbotryum saponariae TaxID=289078 RepID=A0A2X0LIU9_9BASI|nr:BZ3501_MvSof-1269-A2-R1_Chr7-1g09018 [Microbotryum saponariae]SDA03215.1 BZ3500_MvSof-1268-A1-R1_Chr7-1g09313 [Microbotryum saponariae]
MSIPSSSILATIETASFDTSSGQLLVSSDHLISTARSYAVHFAPSYIPSFQPPPREPYQSVPSLPLNQDEPSPTDDARPRKRKRIKRNREDLTPLEHWSARHNALQRSSTDHETAQHHERILARLTEAVENIREEVLRGTRGGTLDRAVQEQTPPSEQLWLGNLAGQVLWEAKPENGRPEFDWVSLLDLPEEPSDGEVAPAPLRLNRTTEEHENSKLSPIELPNRIIMNDSPERHALLKLTSNSSLVLPPRSAFLLQDFSRWSLPGSPIWRFAQVIGGWDLVVLDPPWPNASAARSSSYHTFDPYALGKLDMTALLQSETSTRPTLVAVWLTNKIKYRRLLTNQLFPSWRIDPSTLAAWYWIKTTSLGHPLWSLDSTHRRTYEPLLMGYSLPKKYDKVKYPLPALPRDKVFLGVPLGHSRKPVLGELLEGFLVRRDEAEREGRNVLELFGRTSVGPTLGRRGGGDSKAGVWLSVGNEACKFNVVEEGGTYKGWLRERTEGTAQQCEASEAKKEEAA